MTITKDCCNKQRRHLGVQVNQTKASRKMGMGFRIHAEPYNLIPEAEKATAYFSSQSNDVNTAKLEVYSGCLSFKNLGV